MTRNILVVALLTILGFSGLMIPAAGADIYSWTDENGVRHFTNQRPPKHAELLMKTREKPHDDEAEQKRLEEDKLAAIRQELAEREAFLIQQQAAAERRLAAANARAEATLQEADRILLEAEEAAENNRSGSYWYSYPYYDYKPGLYHNDRNIHWLHHRKAGYHKKVKRHHHRYGHHKKHKRHSTRYGHHGKLRSNSFEYTRHRRTHSIRNHQSLTRSRYTSHRARAAAFRGRHGRY